MTRWLQITLGLAALGLIGIVPGAVGGAPPAPQDVQRVLSPSLDTYLYEGQNAATASRPEIRVGFRRHVDHRGYLTFPLDPSEHPVGELIAAELRLYPEQKPESNGFSAGVKVRLLTGLVGATSKYPPWPLTAGPEMVGEHSTESVFWHRYNVTDQIRTLLSRPDEFHGLELSARAEAENTRFDYVSSESPREEFRPVLVLTFTDFAFPTDTPEITATATATETPEVTATSTASPTATPEPTSAFDGWAFLPRVLLQGR